MVNSHDLVVTAQDIGKYSFITKLMGPKPLLIQPFDSGSQIFLSHPGWSLLVSLSSRAFLLPAMRLNNYNPALLL
jgi:hypothetical protein